MKSLGLGNNCLDGLKKIFSDSSIIVVHNNIFSLAGQGPELSAKQRAMKESFMRHVGESENSMVASATLQSQLNATDQEMQFLVRLLSDEAADHGC